MKIRSSITPTVYLSKGNPQPSSYVRSIWLMPVFFVFTLGLYTIYWFYQNWRQIKKHNTFATISPFGRTLGMTFVPIYNIILIIDQFEKIKRLAESMRITKTHSPGGCFIMMILINFISGGLASEILKMDLWFLYFFTVIPMMLVQRTFNAYWTAVQARLSAPRAAAPSPGPGLRPPPMPVRSNVNSPGAVQSAPSVSPAPVRPTVTPPGAPRRPLIRRPGLPGRRRIY